VEEYLTCLNGTKAAIAAGYSPKTIHDMPLHVRRAIVSVEVVRRNLTAGDGAQEFVYKVKLIDKGRMHELLARHVGLFEAEVQPTAHAPAFIVDSLRSTEPRGGRCVLDVRISQSIYGGNGPLGNLHGRRGRGARPGRQPP